MNLFCVLFVLSVLSEYLVSKYICFSYGMNISAIHIIDPNEFKFSINRKLIYINDFQENDQIDKINNENTSYTVV